jgi:cytochrome c2
MFLNVFADAVSDKGKAIFTTQCTSCHNLNAQLVGPALAGVDKRRSTEWLVTFIRSPKALIEKKDKDAVALYNQFNQLVMPDHQDITADDVSNILAYIKSETKTVAVTAPFATPGKLVPNYHPLSVEKDSWFFIAYLFLVFVLVMLLIAAVNIKDIQRKSYEKNIDKMHD